MMNIVALMGRLTADPELRTTQSGTAVARFRVAVDRDFTNAEGQREADFLNVVAWRGTAEFVDRYFRKGQMIALSGRIQARNYEDKNGDKRTAVEVVAERVSFCGGKREQSGEPEQTGRSPAPERSQPPGPSEPEWTQEAFDSDDDLPF